MPCRSTNPPFANTNRHRRPLPPTSQTRRHYDTKESQSRPPIAICPQITQIDADGRSRDSNTWRGPGRRRTTAGDRWAGITAPTGSFHHGFPAQRPALSKSAGLATLHPLLLNEWRPPPNRRRARRNRRAPGAPAGGRPVCDERSRSEQPGFPPVGGDRQIADYSAANPRYDLSVSARSSLRICVICVICGQIAMGGAGGLCVFASSCL